MERRRTSKKCSQETGKGEQSNNEVMYTYCCRLYLRNVDVFKKKTRARWRSRFFARGPTGVNRQREHRQAPSGTDCLVQPHGTAASPWRWPPRGIARKDRPGSLIYAPTLVPLLVCVPVGLEKRARFFRKSNSSRSYARVYASAPCQQRGRNRRRAQGRPRHRATKRTFAVHSHG